MNVLLTGSEGFIGSNVHLHLDNEDNTVVRADCNPNYGVHLKQDLRNAWGDLIGIDACIHLASLYTSNAPDMSMYLLDHNVRLMEQTLLSCAKNNIKTVVFSSSAAVYGNEDRPLTEADQLNPYTEYGLSKMHCEQVCEEWAATLGLTVISVRLFNAVGFKQTETSLPWQILKAIDENTVLRVFGSAYRPWTYVGDIAKFLTLCASKGADLLGPGHHIFNYSCTALHSQIDLVEELATLTKRAPQIQIESPRLIDPQVLRPSIDKAIAVFGTRIIPRTPLRVGLQEVVSCFRHKKADTAKDEVAFFDSLADPFGREKRTTS